MENPNNNLSYKVADVDFREYGGKFKAISVRVKDNPHHYMNTLHKKKDMGLLHSYYTDTHPEANTLTKEVLLSWEREAIQSQNGKQIFVMENGFRRGIQNYETFMALNFSMTDVRVISDERLDSIPTGEPMPYLTCSWCR